MCIPMLDCILTFAIDMPQILTDAGPVCIITDFYGTRVLYLPGSASCSLQVKPLPHGKGSGLYLRTPTEGESLYFCLMPGQEEAADAFTRCWFSQPEEGASR